MKGVILNDRASWGNKAPDTKAEREELLKKVGRKAFLLPSQLKFPIMLYDKKKKKAVLYKSALIAAMKRALQYGYIDVAKKAARMLKRYFNVDSDTIQKLLKNKK